MERTFLFIFGNWGETAGDFAVWVRKLCQIFAFACTWQEMERSFRRRALSWGAGSWGAGSHRELAYGELANKVTGYRKLAHGDLAQTELALAEMALNKLAHEGAGSWGPGWGQGRGLKQLLLQLLQLLPQEQQLPQPPEFF